MVPGFTLKGIFFDFTSTCSQHGITLWSSTVYSMKQYLSHVSLPLSLVPVPLLPLSHSFPASKTWKIQFVKSAENHYIDLYSTLNSPTSQSRFFKKDWQKSTLYTYSFPELPAYFLKNSVYFKKSKPYFWKSKAYFFKNVNILKFSS